MCIKKYYWRCYSNVCLLSKMEKEKKCENFIFQPAMLEAFLLVRFFSGMAQTEGLDMEMCIAK